MMYKPRVYLGGPIQHVQDNGKGWRSRIKQRDEFNWVDPFDKHNTHDEADEWTNEEIVEDDLFMIDNCQALLVHWENVPVCGTPMEIRYAYDEGIFIVVQTTVSEEDRSPWLDYHTDVMTETFDEAIKVLQYALWCDR